MRKIFLSVALATATLATAAPAVAEAQGYARSPHRPMWNQGGPTRAQIGDLLRDLNRAENGIQRSQQRRMISPREARGLRNHARQIRHRLNIASRNGINNREFGSLRMQVNRLIQRLRIERQDRDGRRY